MDDTFLKSEHPQLHNNISQREGRQINKEIKQPKVKKLNTQDLRGRAEITQPPNKTSKVSPATTSHRHSSAAGVLVENTTEKDARTHTEKKREKAKKCSVVVVKFSSSREATV